IYPGYCIQSVALCETAAQGRYGRQSTAHSAGTSAKRARYVRTALRARCKVTVDQGECLRGPDPTGPHPSTPARPDRHRDALRCARRMPHVTDASRGHRSQFFLSSIANPRNLQHAAHAPDHRPRSAVGSRAGPRTTWVPAHQGPVGGQGTRRGSVHAPSARHHGCRVDQGETAPVRSEPAQLRSLLNAPNTNVGQGLIIGALHPGPSRQAHSAASSQIWLKPPIRRAIYFHLMSTSSTSQPGCRFRKICMTSCSLRLWTFPLHEEPAHGPPDFRYRYLTCA